jgi:hypothetical protein
MEVIPMLRSTIVAGLFLLLPVFAQAQTMKAPEIEVFGGLSYLNVKGYNEREHFFNVATGVTVKVNKHFGLVAEGSLPLGGPSESFSSLLPGFRLLPPIVTTSRETTRTSTALFGPRFYLDRGRTTLFAHGLAGVIRTRSEYKVISGVGPLRGVGILPLVPSSFAYSVNHFAYGFGGGVDVNLNRRFAIRILQADYLRSQVEVRGNQLRLQSGIVVRFGKGS